MDNLKLKSDEIKPIKNYELISVERYYRSQRLHHWVHVLCMLTFFITGLELFIGMYFIGGNGAYLTTRAFHFALGIFIGVWDLVLFSYLIVKHKNFLEIFPTPRDFLDLVIIALCAIRILPDSKYPHYDFYQVDKKKYIMKYHPAQKVLSTTNLFMIFMMGVTGIVLAESISPGYSAYLVPGILVDFFTLIASPLVYFYIDMRFIHFLIWIYFSMTTVIHFYFAIIPQNRSRLVGMIKGRENIPTMVNIDQQVTKKRETRSIVSDVDINYQKSN